MVTLVFFLSAHISHLNSEVLVFDFVQVKDVWFPTKYERRLDLK
jgi:hypothetical protein